MGRGVCVAGRGRLLRGRGGGTSATAPHRHLTAPGGRTRLADPRGEPLRAQFRRLVRPVCRAVGPRTGRAGGRGPHLHRGVGAAGHRGGGSAAGPRPLLFRHRPLRLRAARAGSAGRAPGGGAALRTHAALVRRSVYNPNTRKFFGFSDRWILFPGNYLRSVWSAAGMPGGPSTWEDLLRVGNEIKRRFPEIQIPVGIGFSQDLDSNMAVRALLWSFGASVQDAQENVVLNSEQTVRAVEFGVRLFREVMNPAVLSWNAASNNQALNARQTSFIINPISAYRTAQANRLPVADDIFFVPALRGPGGRWASEHVMGVWVIWRFSRNPDNAKEFLLYLLEHYREAVLASKLYNFPSFMGSVADRRVPVAQ
ncbi:MAG: extracellular solute-binding protein, partial [Armatimonadota bacterium]|nr:extracellular solute-binding protein [Armatimonadota bacterium]